MRRSTGEEGLSVEQALRRYDRELGMISKQYALLPAGEHPRCLATTSAVVGGHRFAVLPGMVNTFVGEGKGPEHEAGGGCFPHRRRPGPVLRGDPGPRVHGGTARRLLTRQEDMMFVLR